jgi:hypothetical protein
MRWAYSFFLSGLNFHWRTASSTSLSTIGCPKYPAVRMTAPSGPTRTSTPTSPRMSLCLAWPERSTHCVARAFIASEDIVNAVLGYFLETTPEYSKGRCSLSLVLKLVPDKIRNTHSERFNPTLLQTPRDEALFRGDWTVLIR